jgi:predicted ATPase/DNA-binding SARP family transcriptional activator
VRAREPVDAPLRCGVLGELVLVRGARSYPVGGRRTAEVLAAVLVDPARPRSVEDLVTAVWGEQAPASAATMVHGAVRRLRTMADPGRGTEPGRFLPLCGGRYAVAPDVVLDAAEFERLLAEARPIAGSSPARAAQLLREALALWRGPAYDGIGQPFAQDEATRLEELRVQGAELLAEAELACGDPGRAVSILEPVVAADPARERAAGSLMVALRRIDRAGDALRVFERVRVVLADALGVEPSPALREIGSAIRRGDDTPRPEPPRRPQALPTPVSSFVGRDDDLARLGALLGEHRLVTVTGPGGSGKTRLAVEVGRRGRTASVFVDLARASSGAGFDDTVADAVGIRVSGARLAAAVAAGLTDEAVLLVLDNAEHVLDRCAGFVREVLDAHPLLRVLATSRERMAIPGERLHLLDPLPVPSPEIPSGRGGRYAAVRLFADRAAAVRPGFALTAENEPTIADICRRLDGLPLAIELAAARASSMSPHALSAALHDRFRLLAPSARHPAPSRHGSLAATIAWSRDLLDDREAQLFRRLGVFPAGFDAEAVRAVTSDPGDDPTHVMGELVETSLIQLEESSDERWRYRMLESTREFARTQLTDDELAALRRRHAHHYLALARHAAPHLHRRGAGRRLDGLHTERDNFRAALEWAAGPSGHAEVLVGLAGDLWHYWDVRGSRGEGLRWLTAGLAVLAPERPERMALLSASSLLHLGRGEFDDTEAAAAEQHLLAVRSGDRRWEGDAQALRATVDWARGRFDRAQQRYEDAVAASLAGGDVWRASMAEAQLARLHRDRAEPDAARALALRAAAHAAEVTEDLALGLAHDVLASVEHRWGAPAEAGRLVDTALTHYRLVGYSEGEASALALQGRIAVTRGDPERARAYLEEALRIHRRIDHRTGMASTLEALAALSPGHEHELAAD